MANKKILSVSVKHFIDLVNIKFHVSICNCNFIGLRPRFGQIENLTQSNKTKMNSESLTCSICLGKRFLANKLGANAT